MVAMNSTASERLALLSNTAMLTNILEKHGRIPESNEKDDQTTLSHYEDPNTGSMAPIHAPPLSPRSGSSSQDRDSLSPHVVTDARRDSPPASFHRSDHKQRYQSYVPNRNFRAQADYPPFPPLPTSQYIQTQTPADRFYRDNRTAAVLAPLAPHPDPQPRMPMDLMLVQSFRSPYEDRRAIPVPCSAGRLPSDSSGRPLNYYSPPLMSVSDDCEDTSERQHQPPGYRPTYEALMRDNYIVREQLHEKDTVISSLQQRVGQLEAQISELRQLPTGKISHIPIEDMLRIMHEYGSEVSNQTLPKRRDNIKKPSIVRQFRRWNPEFFHWFIHVNGEWVPKLGREGELKRRAEKRLEIKRQSSNSKTISSSGSFTISRQQDKYTLLPRTTWGTSTSSNRLHKTYIHDTK